MTDDELAFALAKYFEPSPEFSPNARISKLGFWYHDPYINAQIPRHLFDPFIARAIALKLASLLNIR